MCNPSAPIYRKVAAVSGGLDWGPALATRTARDAITSETWVC